MVKQESRRAATRGAIIGAAFEAFGSEGYADVSVDLIAARAGVAKGAVYHHFSSKDEVFEAVLESVSSAILSEVLAAISAGNDVWEVLAIGNRAFFAACSDPARSRILLHDGPAVLGWARWRRIDERHFGGSLRVALARAMDEGILVRKDVEVVSRVLLGAVTEAAISCTEADDFMACAEEYLDVLGGMLAGLAAKPD
ncbi:MAG: TetR/AcrR family transcriptional regulator [Novosphingobium sp.]|nr:TetR/AcrR family transcriptional regulator [Novosphingobium sp.]